MAINLVWRFQLVSVAKFVVLRIRKQCSWPCIGLCEDLRASVPIENCLIRGVQSGKLCPNCAQNYFGVATIAAGVVTASISVTYGRAGRWEIRPENPVYSLAHRFGPRVPRE